MKRTLNILILLTLLLAAACAGSSTQIVSRGGVIGIQNDSGEPVEIFVDGSRYLVIDPGQQVDLDKMLSGRRVLTARGVESGLSAQREFDLVADQVQAWRIDRFRTVDAEGRPVVFQGSIDVVNALAVPVDVTIPDIPPRTVGAGVTMRINGIETGVVHVVAMPAGSDVPVAMDLTVKPGVVPAFTLAPPLGAVRISNNSGRRAMVITSDRPPRPLNDGVSTVYDSLGSGTTEFAVVDLANRLLTGFRVEMVPGKVIDLTVNRPAGILRVVSDLDGEVTIYADGLLAGTCAAAGGSTIQGLVQGKNHLRAVDSNGDTVATTWLDVGAEPALWLLSATGTSNLRAGTGAIEIENPSRETVSVYIDGYSMGTVAAGGKKVYPDMIPGLHQAAVIGVSSSSFATAAITAAEARTIPWKISLPGSSLSVRNTAGEGVNIYCDGSHVGTVDAGATGVFALEEGLHRIDISGRTSVSTITRSLTLPAGATTTIVFSSQFVTVVATNQFTDPVEVRIDERILGVLNPGERVTVTDVRPGSLRLTATSTLRPVSMTTMISLASGDAFDWFINP